MSNVPKDPEHRAHATSKRVRMDDAWADEMERRDRQEMEERKAAGEWPFNVTPDRAAEHYPGEPAPVEMVRDLQRALFGASYASHRSPADEWAHLIECVKSAVPRAPWDNR